jgi:hypothetical protein
MPRLGRRCLVRFKDCVDHRQQGAKLWLFHRKRPAAEGRQREPTHLPDRLAAQTKDPRRLMATVAIIEHKAPNGGVNSHKEHPRPPPKKASLDTGRVLRRPQQHSFRRYNGRVCQRRVQFTGTPSTSTRPTSISALRALASPTSGSPTSPRSAGSTSPSPATTTGTPPSPSRDYDRFELLPKRSLSAPLSVQF